GKAGGSYSNARAKFEKWCAVPSPLSNRIISDLDFDTPAVGQMRVSFVHATGANIIPIGAEVSFSDMDTSPVASTVELEGYTTTVISRPAVNQIVVACPAGDCSGLTPFYDTYASPDLQSGSINFRMPITAATTTNPLTVTIADAANNIPTGMLVTFTGINGGTHPLNGQSGLITAKAGGTFTIAIDASAMPAITSGFFTLSYPSDDLNNNGIDEENEWVAMDENYFDGQDYSDVGFPVNNTTNYTTDYVPVSPAGVNRRITQQTVYYPLGTRFRALFAGNSSNLNDETGKCRFVSPKFPLDCDFTTPLPVTGANLRAVRKMEGIELTWNVFQELKGYKYELERSYDALSFIPIAGYMANGSGVPYKHLDRAPYVGKNYYRVKISDENGKVSYTNVAQANWSSERAINIYPNPTSDKLNIAFSEDLGTNQPVSIKVTNLMGLLVSNMQYTLQAGQRNLVVDTSNLPKGLYLLEIQVGLDEKIVHKLVIER
ncbi:MAG: T9SS type A sorting domain-containing protein, partial [Raineya sp.]